MEVYHHARRLRRALVEFLRKDFGIHARRNASKINPVLPDDYYDEDLIDTSKNIKSLLRDLLWNITAANTVYASNREEWQLRRNYQTAAIINCQQLLQELQFCEDALPIAASRLMFYVDAIGFEITLLKSWRKSGNAFLKGLK